MKITIEREYGQSLQKIEIDCAAKQVIVGGVKKNVDADWLASRVLQIVSSWDSSYFSDYAIGGEWFRVTVFDNNSQYRFEGRGEYPENFPEFLDLLDEVTE
mgnify:CR=1 FL=1